MCLKGWEKLCVGFPNSSCERTGFLEPYIHKLSQFTNDTGLRSFSLLSYLALLQWHLLPPFPSVPPSRLSGLKLLSTAITPASSVTVRVLYSILSSHEDRRAWKASLCPYASSSSSSSPSSSPCLLLQPLH